MARASLAARLWAMVSFTFIYVFVLLFSDLPRVLFGKRKKIAGQVVVITGGAQGIGKEVGRILATKHSAIVCIIDINEKIGRTTAEEISKEGGGQCFFYRGDISDAEEMNELAKEISNNHGPVSILLANAAILKMGELMDLTPDDYKRNNDVNILGHIFTIKAFFPGMVSAGKGHIVSLGSICSHFGDYCGTAYCTAKFANRGFMEALQMELYEKGLSRQISLTQIFPYFVRTPFIQDLEEPYSTFYDVVEVDTCAKQVVDSILLERMTHFIPGSVGLLSVYLKGLSTKGTLPEGRRVFNIRYVPQRLPEKIV